MCGIVALLAPQGAAADLPSVRRMGATLRHRGPDGDAAVADGPMAMHHSRLAVIDLATGAQPMRDGDHVITYNGEIYNYLELRRELEAQGHAFRTSSDTEVILKSYAQWGVDCVTRFNGMFAFVLYDRARGRVVAARDRFGIKPLYWCRAGESIAWASEVKALLAHAEVRAEANEASLQQYLTLQFVLGADTLFAGIHKLQPAHVQVLDVASRELRESRYWTLHYHVDSARREQDAIEELSALLEDAVRLQLRSDVPVGAHLSGGLDSGVLAALAAKSLPAPLRCYTGTFRAGPDFDETPHARRIASHIGAHLLEVEPQASDFATLLPRLVWHLDEPAAGPGLIPQFAVSQAAAREVKVVLAGQGGDEVFGGYARYLVAYLEQAMKGAIQGTNVEDEHVVSLKSIVPNLSYLERYQPMLQQFWRHGVFESMDRRYFSLVDRLEGDVGLLSDAFRRRYDRDALFARFREIFDYPETQSYYNKMTHFDLSASLPALLQVEDRTSMAVGLESRVPLLDHRLVELMAQLLPRVKFRGGELKYLFKRAAKSLLPESIIERRDKMGFPVPLQHWLAGPSREFVHDTLLSTRARTRGITDPRAVERLLSHETPFSRQSWGLLNLELWFQTFVDR